MRSNMRTTVKKAQTAIGADPSAETTKDSVATATRAIDKMVTKGLVHKNTAARYKSRLIKSRRAALPQPEPKAVKKDAPAEDASAQA